MEKLRISILISILIGVLLTVMVIYNLESEKRLLNEDLVELSKVKYGLFSVDEWEEIISEIITKRINDFDLEDANKEKMREKISGFLQVAIDELEVAYDEKKGFFQRVGASVFDVFGHMEEEIPTITESILNFMSDSENREEIKEYLIKKLEEYSEATFSEIDYTVHDRILAEQGATEKYKAISILELKVEQLNKQRKVYSIGLFSIIILTILGTLFSKNLVEIEFLCLTLICCVLLTVGILLPMINIDARVSEMTFQLLGESIQFSDQVLYFKSKSILEVVILMLANEKVDVILVGFLVLLFSVIFPFSKLISSLIYLYSKKLQDQKVIRFLVFRTAKWSMADVMVVAIFMAFIGFSGIISEQLTDLESIASNVDILTTNESSLQVGFFLFTSFAVLSLAVSHKLQYQFRDSE